MPTTAASSTAGWDATSASSTSTGEMLVPPRMMMSFLRETNQSSSSFAAPHQVTGVVPAALRLSYCRFRIIPVAVENIFATDQEFSDLAIRDVRAMVIDQPNPRVFDDTRDWPVLQAECQGSHDFRCGPEVVEGGAEERRDLLLQIDRAGIRSGEAEPQGSQIPRSD